MRAKLLLSSTILGFGITLSTLLMAGAISQTDIKFPIAELGNCASEVECRTYCNKSENLKACLNFAEKHNLMSKEELAMARKFLAMGQQGPGGCTSKESCEAYCNDAVHIDECLAFAEQYGLISPDELEEAKKVQAALKKGAVLPGGCRNKNECEAYCENPDHMEACIAFAEAAGFIPQEELENAKKAMAAMKKGVKAPPCRGQRACEAYCSEPANFEMCISFAEAAGFISTEEAAMARKTGGKGPGGCRGKEACETFCQDESNFSICVDFAIEHGLMSKEDAEIARKTSGKGPGNCRSREQCEAFCQNPTNQEVCFNFAKEHGLIPEEDLRRMEEGRQKIMELFNQAPPQLIECLSQRLGKEEIEKMKAGTGMPRDISNDIEACMGQLGPMMGPPGEMIPQMPPGEMPSEMPSPPSLEQMQQMMQQSPEIQQLIEQAPPELQQQIQQQIERQIQQQMQQ